MLREIAIMLTMFGIATGQAGIVIDITNIAPRNRTKEPATVSASGGKVGGGRGVRAEESSIAAELLSATIAKDTGTQTLIFQIRLRNASHDRLVIPIDPNLADFEPTEAGRSYSYISAHVFVVFEETKGILRGVTLYGSNSIPSSVANLAPGGSIEIRARTPLTPVNPNASSSLPLHVSVKAGILMQQAVVTPQGDSLREDLKQVGPEVISANTLKLAQGS